VCKQMEDHMTHCGPLVGRRRMARSEMTADVSEQINTMIYMNDSSDDGEDEVVVVVIRLD